MLATTSLAAEGRGAGTFAEHEQDRRLPLRPGDGDAAYSGAARSHLGEAYATRLKLDARAVQAAE